MSAVRELTEVLISGGMHPADAAALVARASVEMSVSGPSKGALRTRKWRAGQASLTVTGDAHEGQGDTTVTKRHKPSPSVTSDNASLSIEEKVSKEIKKKERGANRGCRLSDDWAPAAIDHAISLEMLGPDRSKSELEKFRDHWKQQPGSKGVKLDWDAAWRNWIRRAAEYRGGMNGNRTNHAGNRPAGGSFFDGLRELAADIAGDGAAPGPADPDIPRGRVEIDV